MEQVIRQGGHFVMMVKRNQPNSYEEIIRLFEAVEKDRERMAADLEIEGKVVASLAAEGLH